MKNLIVVVLTIMLIVPLGFVLTVASPEEPSLQQWFNENSYIIDVATNKTGIATFPAGYYRVTMMGEFAWYAPNNTFGWYSIATGTSHQLFTGPDTIGATAEFSATEVFGLYLESPQGIFYTEKSRNPDAIDHAWIFEDPKTERGDIIGWEDLLSGGDKDYQDMVIAMRALGLPHAAFSWFPQSPQVNVTITFNASDSTPGEGYITSYRWDFDDGNTTTTGNPIIAHVYSISGSYTAILNITNNEGKGDSISHTITVVAPPRAAFSYLPLEPQVNEIITFNASDSTPDGGVIVSYNWSFGDGNTGTASNPTITHAYLTYRNYTVTLNITDSEGKSDSVSRIITVTARPHAAFSYSPLHPQVDEAITFNASDSTPDGGTIVGYNWDFGDGKTTTATAPTVTHTYHTHGNYTATLNITDSEQKSDSVSHTITVIGPPHAVFTYSPSTPEVNNTVTFNASASTPDGGTILGYNWNFGDGNTSMALGPIITHVYHTYGSYTVTLNITNTEQKSDSVSHTITVVARPNAAFTYTPLYPRVNDMITFNASESTPDGGYIVSYRWNFSDGSPAGSGVTVTHNYTAPGNYTVTLNATDSEGKWDTESKTIVVQMPAPPAEFDVKIQDEWTLPGDEYVFAAPAYGQTFKAEVRITNALDLYGYEFWLEFDPSLIQLTQHEVLHIHTQDVVTLEEVDNVSGVYKQAVGAKSPARPYNGSAPVANLWFRFIKDPCYPYNYTSVLRLTNTNMIDSHALPIDHSKRHGYFNIFSVRPEIRIECEGKTEIINWIVDKTFTVDIVLADIIRMKGLYLELGWCDCLETNYQNIEITDFLPSPYELYKMNLNNTMLNVQVKTLAEKPAINGTGTILRVTFTARNPWNDVPPYSLIEGKYLPQNCTCKIWIISGWIDVYCPEYRRMEFYNSSYGVNVKNHCNYAMTPIPGDLNLDGIVDISDSSAIARWVGYDSEDPEWTDCRGFDLNNDNRVDLFDVVIVAANFGRTHP